MKTIIWSSPGLVSGNRLWKRCVVGFVGLVLPPTLSILCQTKLLTNTFQKMLDLTSDLVQAKTAKKYIATIDATLQGRP